MRRLVAKMTVVPGTPMVTADLGADALLFVVKPVSGGTVLCEQFNTLDASGVPEDLKTCTAEDASTMTAVASGAARAARTCSLPAPAATGLKFTATTQACDVQVFGTGL